jgi:hypothetical protein
MYSIKTEPDGTRDTRNVADWLKGSETVHVLPKLGRLFLHQCGELPVTSTISCEDR